MLKIRIIPTILFDNFKLIKGVHFESWRTVGSIMQAVKIYNLRYFLTCQKIGKYSLNRS